MTARALDIAELTRILALATRAGSGANMQPWRFVWDGETLRVRCDPTREPSSLNHRGLVTLLTFGGLLEHLEIAATVVGCEVSCELDLADLGATLRFHRVDRGVDPLADIVATRFTDRRVYHGGSLADPVFTALHADTARYPNCRLHLTDRSSDELVQYIADSESFFSAHRPVHLQGIGAVRWSDREVAATADGIPWRSMGVGYLGSRVLMLLRFWPVQALLNRIGYLRVVEQGVRAATASSAGLGLVTVRAATHEHILEVGRLAARMELRLRAAGHGKHPYLAASLFAHEALIDALPAQWPPAFRQRFAEGVHILRRAFAVPPDEHPLWLFRAGKSPGHIPPDHYTRRYPIDRILRVEAPRRDAEG